MQFFSPLATTNFGGFQMWITHHEARTADGQVVSFEYHHHQRNFSGEEESELSQLKTLITKLVSAIRLPIEHKASMGHGGYGTYSRYDIKQHKYAGGGYPGCGGFIEVLEIRDPPDSRVGIVVCEFNTSDGYAFTEWQTLECAVNAFEKCWNQGCIVPPQDGFIRRVGYKPISPWFYAVGNEELMGDWTLPHGMSDDPVFRIGRRFVVAGNDTFPVVKTCVGCRLIKRQQRYSSLNNQTIPEEFFRIAYFSDGSTWDESKGDNKPWPVKEKY